ncbi:MAG: phosphoglycolate phosphatase [Rubrivivax sp.]|nr:phosphoglycolate phosphatase [Rubrivivax sp.]
MSIRAAAVLFDLDGTLIDSAPDLAGTANDMRVSCGLDPLPFHCLRPHAGSGARGMLGAALDTAPGEPRYEALRDDFHRRYEQRMLREAVAFEGITAVLDVLEAQGLPWGIVTNKALRFAEPMAQALGLWPRAAVLVGGDSTPFTKPHPEPLLEAARRLCLPAQRCIYVGDDARDMNAGRAAGMRVVAAAWGYLGAGGSAHEWGADHVVAEPMDLLKWLDMA